MKRLLAFGTTLLGAILVLTALAAAAPRTAAAPSATVPIKIRVAQDGWYRVPLSGLGWTAPGDPTLLHLKTGGADVPFQLHGSNLEFYGQGLDLETTGVRTYYFSLEATQGQRMSSARARASAAGAPTAGSFLSTVTARDRAIYEPKILNGSASNFFGNRICGCPGFDANNTRTFNLTHVDASASTGSIQVTLHGSTITGTTGSHSTRVDVNSTQVGTVTGTGIVPMSGSFSIPANLLVEGNNSVVLTTRQSTTPATCLNAGQPPCDYDRSFTDGYVLSYPHTYVADANRLSFPVSPPTPLTIGGFTSNAIRVVDVSSPTSPKELFGTVSGSAGDFRVSVTPPNGSTRLYAFADSAALTADSVVVDNISTLKSTSNQANLLIITHADFRSAIQPLINQRTTEGLTVFTADVEDVYDEFSNGVHTAQAIKDFITQVMLPVGGWTTKPTNVLLVGDASFDPRNYLGNGVTDFVPTSFVDDGFTTAVHEDWFVDTNNDAKPELGLGRLSVRTAAETTTVVNKIVDYSNLPATASNTWTELIAAQSPVDYDFKGFGENLRTNQLGSLASVATAYQVDGATTSDVITKASNNPTIVNYFGHGNFINWAGPPFQVNDVPSLTNTKPSLYLMMTCLNGYFIEPLAANVSLGEKLLFAPSNHGAIAVFASSGETVPGGTPGEDGSQQSAVKRAQEWLINHPTATLGEAIVQAKGSSTITNDNVRRTWVLLGDPSTKLR